MRPIVTDGVSWSVCRSVTILSPAKNRWSDRDTVWVVGTDGPKDPCIRWESRSPARGNFEREGKEWPIVKYRDCMPSAMQKRLNRPRSRLGCGVGWVHKEVYTRSGVHIGATCQIQLLKRLCAAPMRPFCQLTLTTIIVIAGVNRGVRQLRVQYSEPDHWSMALVSAVWLRWTHLGPGQYVKPRCCYFFLIVDSWRTTVIFTDHFNGPGRAIGPLCVSVCLCLPTITLELDDLWSRYLHEGSP